MGAHAEDMRPELEIDHLLQFVADSPCSFIRNGSQYSAVKASEHIASKYSYVKSDVKNAEDFIRYAASESSLTHEPYLVNCAGTKRPSREWLLEELNRYRLQNQQKLSEKSVNR